MNEGNGKAKGILSDEISTSGYIKNYFRKRGIKPNQGFFFFFFKRNMWRFNGNKRNLLRIFIRKKGSEL